MAELRFNVHIEIFQIRIKIDALLTCNEPLFYGIEFGVWNSRQNGIDSKKLTCNWFTLIHTHIGLAWFGLAIHVCIVFFCWYEKARALCAVAFSFYWSRDMKSHINRLIDIEMAPMVDFFFMAYFSAFTLLYFLCQRKEREWASEQEWNNRSAAAVWYFLKLKVTRFTGVSNATSEFV